MHTWIKEIQIYHIILEVYFHSQNRSHLIEYTKIKSYFGTDKIRLRYSKLQIILLRHNYLDSSKTMIYIVQYCYIIRERGQIRLKYSTLIGIWSGQCISMISNDGMSININKIRVITIILQPMKLRGILITNFPKQHLVATTIALSENFLMHSEQG